MNARIALYRGINVGGKNSVRMEALRGMHIGLGHKEVKSYIQSGNIVFAAKGTEQAISKKISQTFLEQFGFDAKVLVFAAERWERMVAGNPYASFAAKEPQTVHAALCQGTPRAAELAALLAKAGGRELFSIDREVIYLYAPDGLGRSKFAAGMEKASGVSMTLRNWRTIEALCRLVSNDA